MQQQTFVCAVLKCNIKFKNTDTKIVTTTEASRIPTRFISYYSLYLFTSTVIILLEYKESTVQIIRFNVVRITQSFYSFIKHISKTWWLTKKSQNLLKHINVRKTEKCGSLQAIWIYLQFRYNFNSNRRQQSSIEDFFLYCVAATSFQTHDYRYHKHQHIDLFSDINTLKENQMSGNK